MRLLFVLGLLGDMTGSSVKYGGELSKEVLIDALKDQPLDDLENFVNNPLAAWIECREVCIQLV